MTPKPDRQPVYDALDALPDVAFAAYMASLRGINQVFALTVLDDPSPCQALEQAISPHVALFGKDGG